MKPIDLFINKVALSIFLGLCEFKDEKRYLNNIIYSKPYSRYVIRELEQYGFLRVEGLDDRKRLITITEKGQQLYKLFKDFSHIVTRKPKSI